jgi:hypothetical protein
VRLQVSKIVAEFGPRPMGSVRPSEVRAWLATMRQVYAPETVNSIHRTLAQVFPDAVHGGVIPKSPCSRRTSPERSNSGRYVATTEQIWALHDAMPERLRVALHSGHSHPTAPTGRRRRAPCPPQAPIWRSRERVHPRSGH